MTDLLKNYTNMCQNINDVQKKNNSRNVLLLAVSKTKPPSMIEQLYQLNQKDFGENYLQEAIDKQKHLNHLDINWHYIGSIQRNKTKIIANNFVWVHTVEREVIAKRLSEQRDSNLPNLNVCIQVNIDVELSKSGCLPEQVLELAKAILQYSNLNLRGLMVIPNRDNTQAFKQTKQLFDEVAQQTTNIYWDTLSMGMSGDYAEAIVHGANIIRVGSAIFGSRD